MRELAMMRMICDTNYILDPDERTCPKLANWRRSSRSAARTATSRSSSSPSGSACSSWCATFASAASSVRLHTGSVPQTAPPRRDPALQERPGLPRVPEHRLRRHRAQPAERQRRHQLRSPLEPGEARAAHRPRLAQAPDKAGHRHPSRLGRDHRAANDRDAQDKTGASRRRPRPARRSEQVSAHQRAANVSFAAPTTAGTVGLRPTV